MTETKTYNELSAIFQHMNDNLSVKVASQAAENGSERYQLLGRLFQPNDLLLKVELKDKRITVKTH